LGAEYNGKYCGSFGDISFFSFGKDKIISSVFGGAVVVNNVKLLEKLKRIQRISFSFFFLDFSAITLS